MTKILDKLTEIYCFVDDFLKDNRNIADWRRSNNRRPIVSDAEILLIALMQSEFGVESLKKTFSLVAENFSAEFPALCGGDCTGSRRRSRNCLKESLLFTRARFI